MKQVVLLCLLFSTYLISAQSVILDLAGGDNGLLIPRTDSTSILAPEKGLLILDTTTMTFFVYSGHHWQSIRTQDDFTFYYADRDQDTYGDKYAAVYALEEPEGYVLDNTDCNDSDPLIRLEKAWFLDFDADGFGDQNVSMISCNQPQGYVANDQDCDDHAPNNYPGNMEICDGLDNNCNSNIDEPEEACPNPPNVLATYCDENNNYVCAIASCVEGYYDINGVYEEGCESECPHDVDEPNNTCAASTDRGNFQDSQQKVELITGNIIPDNTDSDWLKFVAIDDQTEMSESFDFRIMFDSNPSAQFRIEVWVGGCPGIGNLNDGDHSNDFSFYDYGDPMYDDTQVYYVRVYRDPGYPQNCDSYTLRVSNGISS